MGEDHEAPSSVMASSREDVRVRVQTPVQGTAAYSVADPSQPGEGRLTPVHRAHNYQMQGGPVSHTVLGPPPH